MNKNNFGHFQFNNCEIDVPARELYRDGELISVEPKAFDLLVLLITNRDRAVDKNELQDNIWPDTIVTEASLTRCVMKARRAIGDDLAANEMIKTVRGHGYRFTGDMKNDASAAATDQMAPALAKPSVAVLPFTNLSNDPDQEYFSDGITEDIITELSRFKSLFVIARHSSFSFKESSMTGREIAEALGVSYIVDGSIQRSSNRIRINVRLVDTKNDVQVWSERFDREIEDVLVLQGEVAATVAATIGGRVEATRARQRIDSNGVKSYDRLLQALALYYKVSRDACEKAQHLLEEALSIEPDNARANVLLAAVHSMMSWSFWAEDNDEAQRLSVAFGRKSIELDDTDSLAHALFAEILFDDGQSELAEFHFQRALSLNPNDIAARSLYAAKLSAMGRAAEGLEHLRVAEELDPFGHFWISWIKGSVLFAARRYDEAIDVLQAISVPPNEARAILAAALARVGRTDEAKEQVTGFLEQAKQDMPDYPGDGLAEWIPILARMYDLKDPADFEHLIDSFREAGWA